MRRCLCLQQEIVNITGLLQHLQTQQQAIINDVESQLSSLIGNEIQANAVAEFQKAAQGQVSNK